MFFIAFFMLSEDKITYPNKTLKVRTNFDDTAL